MEVFRLSCDDYARIVSIEMFRNNHSFDSSHADHHSAHGEHLWWHGFQSERHQLRVSHLSPDCAALFCC